MDKIPNILGIKNGRKVVNDRARGRGCGEGLKLFILSQEEKEEDT